MLVNKSFVRQTRRGTLVKIVKEHYLRDDIGCGFTTCPECQQLNSILLDPKLCQMKNKLVKEPHYIIPDTNIVYHQIDLMEHTAFKDVIILQTVLDELRHRSLPVYNRLRQLTSDPDRRFYVFCNEHHKDTFIEKDANETINDRNDRAIRKATLWYQNHIQKAIPSKNSKVVLITDDVDNRKKAKNEGLLAFSLIQYAESMTDHPDLCDMIAVVDEDAIEEAKKFRYDEHLSTLQMTAGLKSGQFYQGNLSISMHNYLEGSIFASVNGKEQTILILGRKNLNRAIQGDTVVVELLPKEQWKMASAVGLVREEEDEEDEERDVDEELEKLLIPSSDKPSEDNESMEVDVEDNSQPVGKVVGILKRNTRPYCGTIDKNSVMMGSTTSTVQSVWFWAMDKRIPKIRIRTRQAKNLIGKRIIVAFDGWFAKSRHPTGHFVKELGSVGDKKTETEVLLLEHDVPFAPFAPKVLSCLPPEGDKWVVNDELHLQGREDFRHIDVCSIDPPGCTDIDDALHARQLPNGNYEVGVHIADVSHFVKPNTAMDDEAARRGTTVYLVDKRIDMLPGLLGTNLCSLHCNVERLAFSCIWEMTEKAEVVNVRYTKSVIRSRNSFTYDEAQARLVDPNMNDPVSKGIKTLNMLAKQLRAKRYEQGALVLASPEVRFKLENDSQDPVDVEMKELKDTNALVEEFMLLANIYVAKKIHSHFPESSMLRRHPQPPASNFEVLQRHLGPMGFELKVGTSKELADSLDACVLSDEPYFNKLLRILTTRCMMQAVYFCSGTIPETDFRHYGLATDIYTHFTSPIRRYADLMVHRLLAACIGYDKTYSSDLIDKSKMTELSDVLNYRHRMAQHASRSSVELYTNLFFKGKTVQEEGFVVRVLKNGFVVLIPKYGIEGIVYTSPATVGDAAGSPDKSLTFDPLLQTLTCTNQPSIVVKVFMRVQVKIQVEDAGTQAPRSKLVMNLLEPKIPGLNA